MQNQIRLFLKEHFDQGLHCVQCNLHLFNASLHRKTTLIHFKKIMEITLGAPIFRQFTVLIKYASTSVRFKTDCRNSKNVKASVTFRHKYERLRVRKINSILEIHTQFHLNIFAVFPNLVAINRQQVDLTSQICSHHHA